MTSYDIKDKFSIYEYGKKLIDKSFFDVIKESQYKNSSLSLKEETASYGNVSRKGGLGELIELYHFNYNPDNESRADFPEAELELKVTPYKTNKNGTISAKERLVISMIDYFRIINENFYQSNAWEKIKNILLIYYEWDQEAANNLDYIIKYVYLFSPTDDDLRIIIQDYLKIQNTVLSGKAHELSESMTMYLGAVTKSSDSSVRVRQPNSEILAKPRAYSLKTSFMTQLLRNKIYKDKDESDSIIKTDSVVDFEDYVLQKINENVGLKDIDLFDKYLGEKNSKSKDRYSRVAYEMLGVRTKNADEFIKANIEVKAIRVEENGNIIESMSFPAFKAKELVSQTWEDSDLYNLFSQKKFLFIIYKKKGNNYYLNNGLFWYMPVYDLDNIVRKEWEETVGIISNGVEFSLKKHKNNKQIVSTNLPKLSNTEITHVRNHSSKSVYVINGIKYGNGSISRDADELPDGNLISKQCFWLNNKYIKKIINKKVDL